MTMDRMLKINRRTFMLGTAAFGAGIGTSSAEGFGIPDPIYSGKPTGQFRWLDTGDQKAAFFRPFFSEYSQKRGMEAIYDALPWNELNTVLPLGIRNGSAPDVFCLPRGMPPALAVEQGWVMPIDDLIPNFEAWKANFPDGAFLEGVNMFGGKTYGLPYTSGLYTTSHTLYNRKYLNEAGFDPETTPLTWETFREAAQKITKMKAGSAYGFIIGGNQPNRWTDTIRTLAEMAGASCGDGGIVQGMDFRTGEVIFDRDEFVGAIELLRAMQADGSVFPGSLGINAPQARALIAQGAAGLIFQGPWNVPQWERENPDFDFGSAPPPAPAGVEPGKYIVQALASAANTMFIHSASTNPQVGADVFHYLGTLQGQTDWGNIVGVSNAPVFPEAVSASSMSAQAKRTFEFLQDIVRIGPNPFAAKPALAKVAEIYREPTPGFGATIQGLVTGQLSNTKEQLTKLTSATNAAIDATFEAARKEGADVSRDDLVFKNWVPSKNYVAADYAAR